MLEQYLAAWNTNNRINLFLIDKISSPGMKCTLSQRGGRDVAAQFAHMHNNRVWHLAKRAKDLSVGLVKFATKTSPLGVFMEDIIEGKPKRGGFEKGLPTLLSYLVAHDSHHRGSIMLTLKQCGHKLDNAEAYRIWDWDPI